MGWILVAQGTGIRKIPRAFQYSLQRWILYNILFKEMSTSNIKGLVSDSKLLIMKQIG